MAVTSGAHEAVSRRWNRQHWAPVIAAVAISIALFLLYRVLRRYRLEEIVDAVAAIPSWRVALAALCAAGSYTALSLFDALAIRYIGRKLPYYRIALASFTALSIGHSIGFSALSTGTLRFRFYMGWGLRPGDVGRIIVFCASTVGVGLAALSGLSLLAEPALASEAMNLPQGAVRLAGGLVLVGVCVYVVAAWRVRQSLVVGRWHLPMPPLRLALLQLVVGCLNYLLVAGCLYNALGGGAEVPYFRVAAAYAIASVAGLIAHVPGNWGLLEAVVILLLPELDPIGALVAFRLLYYLVPFAMGLTLLGITELVRVRSSSRAAAPETP
jgi:glycosyltransferase 2 family protein